MKLTVYLGHVVVLLVGTVFAWVTIILDFLRFYNTEGTIFKLEHCIIPNPVTTPCFYGAFAFALGLAWAMAILKKEGDERRKSEKHLAIFLTGGSIFAWTNFLLLAYDFYHTPIGQGVGCSGVPTSNPFVTPCFVGAVLFLVSLIFSLFILRKDKSSS